MERRRLAPCAKSSPHSAFRSNLAPLPCFRSSLPPPLSLPPRPPLLWLSFPDPSRLAFFFLVYLSIGFALSITLKNRSRQATVRTIAASSSFSRVTPRPLIVPTLSHKPVATPRAPQNVFYGLNRIQQTEKDVRIRPKLTAS